MDATCGNKKALFNPGSRLANKQFSDKVLAMQSSALRDRKGAARRGYRTNTETSEKNSAHHKTTQNTTR